MSLAGWPFSDRPGTAGLRDGLIRTSLVFAPYLEAEPFANQIGSLNHCCFFLSIFIIAFFNTTILFAEGFAGLAPGTTLLPAVTSLMERVENGECAHLRQSAGGFSQGTP